MSFLKLFKGMKGEQEAERHLKRNGYSIIERNFSTRFGEVDLIAKDGQTLAFVEVRSKDGSSYGTPEESIGLSKQRRIIAAAKAYLNKHNITDTDIRFDCVTISSDNGKRTINLIKNAFDAIE